MSDDYVLTGPGGSITVTAAALSRLVRAAAESVDGARVRRPRRALEVHIDGDATRVTLELVARYGSVLPDVARAVQERVAEALARSCGLRVESVDVAIEELERKGAR
jgi:uncharacterized alkaline shock family protein YloU